MLRLLSASELHNWACKLCTFLMLACLMSPNFAAIPVVFSASTPANSSATEEETHSVVRCDSARQNQLRIRSFSVKTVSPLRDLRTQEGPLHNWRVPQPRILPCFVGSGIRMLC